MQNVINRLNQWIAEVETTLQQMPEQELEQRALLIGLKNEIELSLKQLVLCEQWQILPTSIVKQLPLQKVQSPSSEYRIMEDCESDNRQLWIEADFDGTRYRFNQGDLVIQRRTI